MDAYTAADLATESNNSEGHDEEVLDAPDITQSNGENENGDGDENERTG